MPDFSLADIETALKEKLPSHTFRAVSGRADRIPEENRFAFLSEVLERREADERWTAERKKGETSKVGNGGARA